MGAGDVVSGPRIYAVRAPDPIGMREATALADLADALRDDWERDGAEMYLRRALVGVSDTTRAAVVGAGARLDDITASFAFVATRAPESYDGGPCVTVARAGGVRTVAVPRDMLAWQRERYLSGLHGADVLP